jgi:hypothetical protein
MGPRLKILSARQRRSGAVPERSPIPAVLIEPLAGRCHGKGSDDLVMTSPEGPVLRSGNFRQQIFDPAAMTAGLPDLSPHDLRHTAASLLVASGANVKAVQRMLGHASAAMTLDSYSGLFEDDFGALAERMDAPTTPHGFAKCRHRVGTGQDRRSCRRSPYPLSCANAGGAGGARTRDPGIMSTSPRNAVLTCKDAGRRRACSAQYPAVTRSGEITTQWR